MLKPTGTLYLHLDYREVHYVRCCSTASSAATSFLNEIIWAYDYGGRPKNRWPAKHDTILVYVKDPARYFFDSDAGRPRSRTWRPGWWARRRRRAASCRPTSGGTPSCRPTGKEKTGYPTQKPRASCAGSCRRRRRRGRLVLDFFAGSGTTGAVAAQLGRRFVLVDRNPEAIAIMRARLPHAHPVADQPHLDGRPRMCRRRPSPALVVTGGAALASPPSRAGRAVGRVVLDGCRRLAGHRLARRRAAQCRGRRRSGTCRRPGATSSRASGR